MGRRLVRTGRMTTVSLSMATRRELELLIMVKHLVSVPQALDTLVESYYQSLTDEDRNLIGTIRKELIDGTIKPSRGTEALWKDLSDPYKPTEVKNVLELSQDGNMEVFTDKEPDTEEFFTTEDFKNPCDGCNPEPGDCDNCKDVNVFD
jgi:hypothetical protein